MQATIHLSVISTACKWYNKGAAGATRNVPYLNSSLEVVIVHRWQVYAGEQITQNPIEEGHILVQKLRQVDVIDGPEHEDVLPSIQEGTLQVAGSTQHTDHSSHAIVIVVLAAQLLAAQPAVTTEAKGIWSHIMVAIRSDAMPHMLARPHVKQAL